MSAQNSTGIQTLLEAERKAHEIVQNARAYRTQRLKAAKTDATKEINEYKQKKETDFQQKESQHSGTTSKAEEQADSQIQSELASIKEAAVKGKDSVIKQMLEAVTTPKPTPHINA